MLIFADLVDDRAQCIYARAMSGAVRRLRQLGRSLVRLFWAMDRALGGDRPPTRAQRYAALHPLRVGLVAGAIATGAFALVALTSRTHPTDIALVLLVGVMMGAIFALTARGERARQTRLRQRKIWNDS
ncbi:Integral membrane protein OS=Streptomyces aurantiogriseus OX=66870 GN=GCM10010251_04950 PE=4 SV=1 [Streptomyces aurantiogriseus]|uniref:Uncharacterized protein n=1 Tax=Streptomyces aurantiogriseus TaxID=66870 RepID=A0A918EZB7_9ACTN|nr:hypothetical protein GCM10010251_04950 [Streptomyces aurantiogriseus]